MPSLEERADALFDDLPSDPSQRLDAVGHLYALIRERAAEHLEPAVRDLVQQALGQDYEAKLRVTRSINHVLQDARLAIADPVTELPAALLPNRPRPSSHVSRLCLRDNRNGADGKRHAFHLREHDVPALHLVRARLDDAEDRRR